MCHTDPIQLCAFKFIGHCARTCNKFCHWLDLVLNGACSCLSIAWCLLRMQRTVLFPIVYVASAPRCGPRLRHGDTWRYWQDIDYIVSCRAFVWDFQLTYAWTQAWWSCWTKLPLPMGPVSWQCAVCSQRVEADGSSFVAACLLHTVPPGSF